MSIFIKVLTYQSRHHELVDAMVKGPTSMHGAPFLVSCNASKIDVSHVLLGKPWMHIQDVIYRPKINVLLVEYHHGSLVISFHPRTHMPIRPHSICFSFISLKDEV